MLKKQTSLFWAMIILAGFVLFGTGCQAFASAYEYKGSVMNPPLPVPDFELKSTEGHSFHLSDVEGDIALVFFGYTFCPDVCPLTMFDVRNALADLDPADLERVHVIFISADPERDTPEVLARYLNGFDSRFIGLTDNWEKIQAVMKPFGAFAEKEEVTDSAAGYLVSHTGRLYLVGPEREILLTYPFGFKSEDLHSDLNYLLENLQ